MEMTRLTACCRIFHSPQPPQQQPQQPLPPVRPVWTEAEGRWTKQPPSQLDQHHLQQPPQQQPQHQQLTQQQQETADWLRRHSTHDFVAVAATKGSKKSKFEGEKPGFVFKLGDRGLGYYRDAGRQVITISLAAAPLPPPATRPPS